MPDDFLHLPAEEQANIIQTCAAKLGRRPEHLEKDVWICWVLQNLFAMPQCLPKAFRCGGLFRKKAAAKILAHFLAQNSADYAQMMPFCPMDSSVSH